MPFILSLFGRSQAIDPTLQQEAGLTTSSAAAVQVKQVVQSTQAHHWSTADYAMPTHQAEIQARPSAIDFGLSHAFEAAQQNQHYETLPADLSTFWPAFATLPPQSQTSSPLLSGATASASSSRAPSPPKDAGQQLEKQALSSAHIPAQTRLQIVDKTRSLPLASSQYTSPTQTCTSADTDTSIEENAARGVAYISLEAAAETHYVGQSSGATWASLILK